MNDFANGAVPPAFDAARMRVRARHRTGLNAAAAAVVLLVAAAGSALALTGPSPEPTQHAVTAASSGSSPAGSPAPHSGSASPVPQPTGGDLVVVPDVMGMTLQEATHVLVQAGLTVQTRSDHDWRTPADHVIDAQPAGGTKAPKGSTVSLFISLGKPGS
ncbi:hypothetical protein DN069_17615 [Streptacidiphilus pinicola]|uniref:PASTA domain-containing protein n=1 Tax=Streptacidiphilus pinicola TaxID=2219663 RepID=A0A2X0J9Y9_9ACTN|nr:PASTA domain-containing protein [Streptacidiphilus pinicola]RAG84308.1 hypothetical protein DN069_17615 [Streptacidiphilus pinicola]